MTEVELTPTAMAAGGAALARDADGRVVFVEGALPGERVTARVTDARKDYARAVTLEILAPSPHRISPPCAARGAGCGGCTWLHVSPDAQVALKADIVVDALRRIGRLPDPPAPVAAPARPPARRTTARLGVSDEGRAGHRPRAGAGVVETSACMAAHPLLNELIVDGRYPGAGEVLLRVGVASGERLVRVRARGRKVRVPAGVIVVQEGDGRLAFVHEDIAGRRFRVSVDSFFQPGPEAAAGLVAAVTAAAGSALRAGAHVVDAYAGVGLFAATLGSAFDLRVTALETQAAAVADAQVNLGDLDARVVKTEVGRWRPEPGDAPIDLVIADPSRSGLGSPGVTALTAAGAPRLVLVSCDPASLARDTALLARAGYRLGSISLVDAFPDTFHVETVARFDRGRI